MRPRRSTWRRGRYVFVLRWSLSATAYLGALSVSLSFIETWLHQSPLLISVMPSWALNSALWLIWLSPVAVLLGYATAHSLTPRNQRSKRRAA